MTSDASQIKDAVRDQWTHAADAWGRWHPQMSEMSREVTDLLCHAARLAPGQAVLDLAGGTGEPTLTAARMIEPGGTVTYTDLVPGMLAAAEANASAAGITNVVFRQADAEAIPFDDATFDRVISRFGIMFPPDTQRALTGIGRVTKPGGRVAFAVWASPDQNAWFAETNQLLLDRGLTQPPPPGMPSPFRFGKPGSLPEELRAAGFADVEETPHEIPFAWPGSPDDYMQFLQHTFPAWRRGLEAADPATRDRVLGEIGRLARKDYDGNKINLGGNILVVAAAR